MSAQLVAELVVESWAPPYTQPLIVVPADVTVWPDPIWDAIRAGLVCRRPDGVLIPARPVDQSRGPGRADVGGRGAGDHPSRALAAGPVLAAGWVTPSPSVPPGRDPSTHDHKEHTMTDPDVEHEITMSAATVASRLSRACRVDPLLPARLPAGVLAALRDYDAMADGSEAVAS